MPRSDHGSGGCRFVRSRWGWGLETGAVDMRRAMFAIALIAATFVAAPSARSVVGNTISVSSVEIAEGAAGQTTSVAVTVELSQPALTTVNVTVTPTAGTARVEADFK